MWCVHEVLLQNPLASPYTLGVSSCASLGAAFVIILGISIPVLAGFMLPFAGGIDEGLKPEILMEVYDFDVAACVKV